MFAIAASASFLRYHEKAPQSALSMGQEGWAAVQGLEIYSATARRGPMTRTKHKQSGASWNYFKISLNFGGGYYGGPLLKGTRWLCSFLVPDETIWIRLFRGSLPPEGRHLSGVPVAASSFIRAGRSLLLSAARTNNLATPIIASSRCHRQKIGSKGRAVRRSTEAWSRHDNRLSLNLG